MAMMTQPVKDQPRTSVRRPYSSLLRHAGKSVFQPDQYKLGDHAHTRRRRSWGSSHSSHSSLPTMTVR